MPISRLNAYRFHPQRRVGEDSDSEVAYLLAHDAASGDTCNTNDDRYIGQHYVPSGGDHRYDIRRLPMYFWIALPVATTINSATLSLTMFKRTNFGGEVDYDWTLSIRKNDSLSAPSPPGSCPVIDFSVCLGGTQIASKYVDDLSTSSVVYEFALPDLIGEDRVIVPQTYLKLVLVSSKDLASTAPDIPGAGTMLERVQLVPDNELILDYTLPTTEVTTNPATLLSGVSATLNGTLTDGGGESCYCWFDWGLTDAYGETTTAVSKETGETFSANITGLSSGKTYHFRAKARNSFSRFEGEDLTFTCPGYFAWII